MNSIKIIALSLLFYLVIGAPLAAIETPETGRELHRALTGSYPTGDFRETLRQMEALLFGNVMTGEESARWETLRGILLGGSDRPVGLLRQLAYAEWRLRGASSPEKALQARLAVLEKSAGLAGKDGEPLVFRLEFLANLLQLPTVVLPARVSKPLPIRVVTAETVDSRKVAVGREFHFTLAQDLVQDGVLIAPRGSEGTGTITRVRRGRRFGVNGSLEALLETVTGLGPEPIQLTHRLTHSERSRVGQAVTASLVGVLTLGPVGGVGGLFVSGRDARIPAGTEWMVEVTAGQTLSGFRAEK